MAILRLFVTWQVFNTCKDLLGFIVLLPVAPFELMSDGSITVDGMAGIVPFLSVSLPVPKEFKT